ncbi:MAG: cell division protein FtsQ/DivIB, partial [Alphaproteobacteria bacterium]|nr:cell division protein FtsQ/DivIB [Alphaproteobacteria bacterium]
SGKGARLIATTEARLLAASADAGLAIDEILVEGRAETARDALVEALAATRGDPILAFDPDAARARLEALPWVRSAWVEKRLPDTVYLRIVERQPLALWQRDGALMLVDADGVILQRDGLERFADLPVLVGDNAPRNAARLLALLAAEPELKKRIRAAIWIGDRRWNLRLDNGIDIRLSQDDPGAAWARLAALDRRHGLLSRDIKLVDLRQPDRLILRMSEEAATRASTVGKDT